MLFHYQFNEISVDDPDDDDDDFDDDKWIIR